MKTVFNRALSLVMCLILVFSTVSVMAFGVSAKEDFDYKTYAQNVTKENVHHFLDALDEGLKDANINETIDLKIVEININLTSIDAVCDTIDRFRTVINIGKGLLGDLKDLNLKVFDEGMSRAKSGDYKIFCELLELASANGEIIEKLVSGKLDLGNLAEAAGLDLSGLDISSEIRKGIVDAFYDEGDANYAAAKNRALTDFDAFVYTDVMGLLSKQGAILEGVTIKESTTIDDLITNIFDIIINKYLIDSVSGLSLKFSDIDAKYAELDNILQLDGQYDFSEIGFTNETSVLNQINNVLGKAFKVIVPSYNDWAEGGYTLIGSNVENIVRYVAEKSAAFDTEGKSSEQLMLEIFKLVAESADPNGVYLKVKDAKSLRQLMDKLLIHVSGKAYSADATFEHVLGDYVIGMLEGIIPLYDTDGKTPITANGKKTVWEVLNSALNFFLVDKNLDNYFGMSVKRSDSYFKKLDIILDYTADDGSADFSSEEYFTDLLDSIFTVDIQQFVNLTAAKALGKGRGSVSVVTFLYNTAYNMLNNWSASTTALKKYGSKPFNSALSNDGLANILKVFIDTMSSRAEGTACLVGLIVNFITDIDEKVEIKDSTCTAIGYSTNHKTCLKCGKVYLKGTTVAAKGHKFNSGKVTKNPTCTAKGEKTYTCTVCGATKKESVNATGHKYDSGKITKAPTCTAAGVKTYTCTVKNCKATKTSSVSATGHKLGSWKTTKKATYTATGTKERKCTNSGCKYSEKQTLKRLTLSKVTGLKASAVSTSSIKFSWKKVTGAESYILYYKTGSGKWKTVKTKKTSATVKKLKTGTTYKFKVVAVAGKYKSKDSSTVSGTTKPATVTLKDLRSKKKKEVVVEWKKVSGVTGYEITYSTSKKFTKKTTKTATIKKQSTSKTIIKKLKSKKKYYVKVRAYKTVNKVKVYGAYSKVKSIKCK